MTPTTFEADEPGAAVDDRDDERDAGPDRGDGAHNRDLREQDLQSSGDGSVQYGGDHHGDVNQLYASMQMSEAVARRVLGRRTAPPPMNPDSLRRLGEVFAAPDGYCAALQVLRSNRAVVITGPRGAGRHSAAMMLLSEVAESCHDLSHETDEDEELVDPESVGAGEGLLLDLSACSEETVRAVLRRWEPLRAKLTAKGCFSAVVLWEKAEHLLNDDLRTGSRTIGSPDGRTVFEQHLGARGVCVQPGDLDTAELPSRLQRSSMGELGLLARLVHDADPRATFGERLRQALAALEPRPEHVTSWLRQHHERREHALMLSAAMLEGAHTDAVFAASEDLRGVVDPADDVAAPLEREGITERLAKVDVVVDRDRCVHFGSLEFDQQVRTNFWREHPGLRDELRDWVGRVAPRDDLDQQARNGLVVRFAEQALSSGRPDDLSELAERWVRVGRERRPPAHVLACVGLLLRIGLLDERFGGTTRQKIYDWVARRRDSAIHPSFDRVLIALCEGVIAPSLPAQALVRLNYLARREDQRVAREAAERIEVLAGEPIFFRRALHRLVHYLQRSEEDSNAALFLRIVDPQRLVSRGGSDPLLADRGVREQLVTGWRSVLGRPVATWQPRVRDWLQDATDESERADLVDVLVEAADRRTSILSRLHGIARRWAEEATGETKHRRRLLVARLLQRIDAAQDLEFRTNTGEAVR